MEENNDIMKCSVTDEKSVITSTIAMFRNFSPDQPVKNAVLCFWESHTDNTTDKARIQATSDLISKTFDVENCEAYEVRTGYLSRYNFLDKNSQEATEEDWERAIQAGLKSESDWVKRCEPYLPGFKLKSWDECISSQENPYYEQCKDLLRIEMGKNGQFKSSFYGGVEDYAERHGANKNNGTFYMLEEMAWIFSLPLVHWGKQVYLIHVGNDNPGIRDMFRLFPDLAKAVKWLSPRCRDDIPFSNMAEFLMYYATNNYAGCSYAVENRDLIEQMRAENDEQEQRKRIA